MLTYASVVPSLSVSACRAEVGGVGTGSTEWKGRKSGMADMVRVREDLAVMVERGRAEG